MSMSKDALINKPAEGTWLALKAEPGAWYDNMSNFTPPRSRNILSENLNIRGFKTGLPICFKAL